MLYLNIGFILTQFTFVAYHCLLFYKPFREYVIDMTEDTLYSDMLEVLFDLQQLLDRIDGDFGNALSFMIALLVVLFVDLVGCVVMGFLVTFAYPLFFIVVFLTYKSKCREE